MRIGRRAGGGRSYPGSSRGGRRTGVIIVAALFIVLAGAPNSPTLSASSFNDRGFDEAKMWEKLFKSPTATRSEMNAREKNGGKSPYAGKTTIRFSAFYPNTKKIVLPADLSATDAALAYAYELRHFEQVDELLRLQSDVRKAAIPVEMFVNRCMELEAEAAYRQVQVARELRKAWVFGADSAWEAYCDFANNEKEAVLSILEAMNSNSFVAGTGRSAREYYVAMAEQQVRAGSSTGNRPENMTGSAQTASR